MEVRFANMVAGTHDAKNVGEVHIAKNMVALRLTVFIVKVVVDVSMEEERIDVMSVKVLHSVIMDNRDVSVIGAIKNAHMAFGPISVGNVARKK